MVLFDVFLNFIPVFCASFEYCCYFSRCFDFTFPLILAGYGEEVYTSYELIAEKGVGDFLRFFEVFMGCVDEGEGHEVILY